MTYDSSSIQLDVGEEDSTPGTKTKQKMILESRSRHTSGHSFSAERSDNSQTVTSPENSYRIENMRQLTIKQKNRYSLLVNVS